MKTKNKTVLLMAVILLSSCVSKETHEIAYLPMLIYFIGVYCSYRMLKISYISYVCQNDKNEWDWSGIIPCLFFSVFSWGSFLIAFLMVASLGVFDKKNKN